MDSINIRYWKSDNQDKLHNGVLQFIPSVSHPEKIFLELMDSDHKLELTNHKPSVITNLYTELTKSIVDHILSFDFPQLTISFDSSFLPTNILAEFCDPVHLDFKRDYELGNKKSIWFLVLPFLYISFYILLSKLLNIHLNAPKVFSILDFIQIVFITNSISIILSFVALSWIISSKDMDRFLISINEKNLETNLSKEKIDSYNQSYNRYLKFIIGMIIVFYILLFYSIMTSSPSYLLFNLSFTILSLVPYTILYYNYRKWSSIDINSYSNMVQV